MSRPEVRPVARVPVELRTGQPYANLIGAQITFAQTVGKHFGIDPQYVLPTEGTTGAIESVRNHVFKTKPKRNPTVLTVSPGYWRAREAFEGLGFEIVTIATMNQGFEIDEEEIVRHVLKQPTDMIYLSLPNNPTGAIFDPERIVNGVSEETAIMFDLTLPSRNLDPTRTIGSLWRRFEGRKNLFIAGSTSKSHSTAECRIGWALCTDATDAAELKKENRNVVSIHSIEQGTRQLGKQSTTLAGIELSFSLLKERESFGVYEIVKPFRRVETAYVLVRIEGDPSEIRSVLKDKNILVMWGSEFGLTDNYIRVETIEPANLIVFIESVNSSGLTNPARDLEEL